MLTFNVEPHVGFFHLQKLRPPDKKKKKMVGKTHKAVIINGEDVLLLRHHVAKAAASRVLEGDAGGPRTQKLVDVIAIVEFIVKTRRNLNGFGGVTILHNDQMVRLKEWPPHLKKVKVPYGGDNDVKFIFQWRCGCNIGSVSCHCNNKVKVTENVPKRVW